MREQISWMEREDHAFLRRGRIPYAKAILKGGEGSPVKGELSFYHTPAGVMISAEVEGLSGASAVYGFCFCEEDGGGCRERGGLCSVMPLIYGKGGKGRCSLVTERLSRIPLSGRKVFLRESAAPSLCRSIRIAEGTIQ